MTGAHRTPDSALEFDHAVEELGGGRPCVLVVDDRELNVELMAAYLSDLDCRVETAFDGTSALEAVDRLNPSLVLLDVMMPGLSGYEVCARLKSSPSTQMLPVVLVTALGQTADVVRGLETGADDFLTKPVEREELVARVRSLLHMKALYDRLDDAERVIFSLARAVEAKDGATELHTERVGRRSRKLGEAVGIQGDQLDDLYRGAIIHDIGKIGVPDAILLKPGPLDEAELTVMRRHPVIGHQIVQPLKSARSLLPIIRSHHERIDGHGYPDRLSGSQIPLTARIVAICDAFDAMISRRPYRPGLNVEQAEAELRRGAGTQWDADLVEVFLSRVLD